MLRFSSRRYASVDYKTGRLSEIMVSIATRNTTAYDHVVVDAGAFTGNGLRLCRDLFGPERDVEVARFVTTNALKPCVKKLKPAKSLAFFIDGTDAMWKCRSVRAIHDKKTEGRFHRSAASPLSFAVEDRAKFLIAESPQCPPEVVISGPATPGPVECKMSQWCLDLGNRALQYESSSLSSSSPTPVPSSSPSSPKVSNLSQQQQQQSSSPSLPVGTVTRSDSIALIGGGDTYIMALAMTPFHNITCLMSERGDFKGTHMSDLLDWHGLTELFKSGDNVKYTRARIDLTLIHLIASGFSSFELKNLPGMPLKTYLETYMGIFLPAGRFLTKISPASSSSSSSTSSSSSEHNSSNDKSNDKSDSSSSTSSTTTTTTTTLVEIDIPVLEAFLSRVGNVKSVATGVGPKQEDALARDYLEILLQSLNGLTNGGFKNYGFVPKSQVAERSILQNTGAEKLSAPTLTLQQVVNQLRFLNTSKKVKTLSLSVDPSFALTPSEMLFVGSLQHEWITQTIPAFTGGHPLPAGVAEALVYSSCPDINESLQKTRDILSHVDSSTHRSHKHSPSHCWRKTPGCPGPPPGYFYSSVNLGINGEKEKVLERIAASPSLGLGNGDLGKPKNSLVIFESDTRVWQELDTKMNLTSQTSLVGAESSESSSASESGDGNKKQLTIVNWNVQFNRYSGKTTPLGKPGIDWCSATRYVALAKVLSTCDADIIGMQECEAPWWEYLSRQPWVQENYAFSCMAKGESISPWGSMMLVHKKRVPVNSMLLSNIPGHSGHVSLMPTCNLQLTDKVALSINACHLLAPYTQNNIDVRVQQINKLMARLAPKFVGEDVIVMGDFNDYPSNFFVMPKSMGGFVDAWEQVHGKNDGDAGWTINGKKSPYTSQIIEEEFYGRADRMLVKSSHLKAADACLIGTRSVRTELGITSCPAYLFPSDHFGVKVTFDVI